MAENDIAVLDIQVNTNAKDATQDLAGLQKQAGSTADTVKQLATATGATGPASQSAATGVRQLTTEITNTRNVTRDFRDVMHSIDPILRTAGVSMGGFGQYLVAARAGAVGLGVALTGSLIVAMENISDKAKQVQGDLAALAGSQAGGASAFASIKNISDQANLSIGTLASGYGQLLLAQQKYESAQGIIYAPGAAGATAQLDKLAASFANAAVVANASDSTIEKFWTTFTTALANGGALTTAAWQQMISLSPQMAAAIAKAFDNSTIAQFSAKVEAGTETYAKLIEQSRAGDPILAKQASETVPTLGRSFENLTNNAGKLAAAIGGGGGVNEAVQGMARYFADAAVATDAASKQQAADLKTLQQSYADARQAGSAWAVNMTDVLGGLSSAWTSFANVALGALAAVKAAMATGGGPSGSTQIPLQAALNDQLSGYAGPNQSTGGGYDFLTQQLTEGGVTSGYASGVYAQVPSGYPNDSYTAKMQLTEGERVIVVPKSKTLSDIIGGKSPIDLGRRAAGADLGIGPGGSVLSSPNIDAAITPQGGAILSLVDKFSGVFSQVGDTMQDVKSVVSAAGNGKTNDVIRLSAIQTIGAVSVGFNTLAQVISSGDSAIISAIGGLGSSISSAASSNAASSGASGTSSTASVASGGGSGGFRAASGGGINNPNDPLGLNKTEIALGAVNMPFANPTAASAAAAKAAPNSGLYSDPFNTTGIPSSVLAPSPGLSKAGTSITDMSMAGGFDESGFSFPDSAGGNEFIVPGSGGTDSVRLQGRVSPGEHVKITPKADVSGKGSPNSRTSPAIQNVTINLTAKDYASFVKSGSQLGQQARMLLDKALTHG